MKSDLKLPAFGKPLTTQITHQPSPGTELVSEIQRNLLGVGYEGSRPCIGGFIWFPLNEAQYIMVDRSRISSAGTRFDRVVVETNVCKLVELESGMQDVLAQLTKVASLSGLIKTCGQLRLHSHAWVDATNQANFTPIFELVAGLQIIEAALIREIPIGWNSGEPNISSPIERLLEDATPRLQQLLEQIMTQGSRSNSIWSSDTIESWIRREDQSKNEHAKFSVSLNQKNLASGEGLRLKSSFPACWVDLKLRTNPIALNSLEVSVGNNDFFGTWNAKKGETISYSSFIPNVLADEAAVRLLVDIAYQRFCNGILPFFNHKPDGHDDASSSLPIKPQ